MPMMYYHPHWIQQPMRDDKEKILFQLNSAEISELHEILLNFLSMIRIATNWEILVKIIR